MNHTDRLLTMQEVSEYLGVSLSWVKKRVATNQLPHTRLGKNVRFTWAQVSQIVSDGEAIVVQAGSSRSRL